MPENPPHRRSDAPSPGASLRALPLPPQRPPAPGLTPLQGLLHVTRLLRSQGDPSALLKAIAGAVSESLGFATVVVNLYRPAWDDFCVATVQGSETASDALLGETSDWSVWRSLLDDRFLRRGAYLIPHQAFDWTATGGPPEPASASEPEPWHPEDTLLVPLVRSDGTLAGILSVDEPASGHRPTDEDLDVLVAFGAHAALALEQADEARAAARDQAALAQLLEVSSQLHATVSVEATLRSVCAAIRSVLGFGRVTVELLDDEGGCFSPVAVAGDGEPDAGISLAEAEALLDPAFEREGCLLIPADEVEARVAASGAQSSTSNGRGPHAWNGHWLIVPLHRAEGGLIGFVRAGEPEDRLLPSANRLQALRAFANQVTTALQLAEQVETIGRSQEQLRQAQKMDAVGRLAGGLAHDFNNLLTAIGGYGELALARLGDRDEAPRRHVGEMKRAAETGAELTRQLLAFSRKQALQPAPLDLNTVVGDMAGMIGRLIGRQIELRTVLDASLRLTRVDSSQLQQVLLNLAINARDAMPEGGRLLIETANAQLDERAGARIGVEAGSYVELTVSDTGLGMDAETRAHVFEPFFTTKEQGRGTGLGLSTVYGIVAQSSGHIVVESELGSGTKFSIYLPCSAEATATSGSGDEPDSARGTETILLVDDQELVRNVVQEMLADAGYRVLAAQGASDALALVRERSVAIDLLVTDVALPGLSGPELAERVRAERPGLRVLFTSGHSEDALGLEQGAAFLEKPFGAAVLTEKVRALLDA